MSRKPRCQAKNPEKCVDPQCPERRNQTPKTFEEYAKKKEAQQSNAEELVVSNGVPVVKGKIAVSNFAKGFNSADGINSYFDGSWEELTALVKDNFDNFEPGFGSVNNDVILVNVPTKNFYTSITPITDDNKHLVEERDHVRQEGEKPVGMKIIKGNKNPARHVQIVVYRADTLAQDNDRSSNAEWEIIAINAQLDKYTPMHPTTMLRNSNHEEGGTYREYTDQQWAEAYEYWNNHAYLEPEKK